jgi:hypothetical protein
MTKYFVEVELRTFYLTEVNADDETSVAQIVMKNPELWNQTQPIDQAYGIHSVLDDNSDEVVQDE